jgi:hypothetical protein
MKLLADESAQPAGRGSVCLKAASSVFSRGKRTSAIAARGAGRKRGDGRDGKRSNDTGKRCRANKNAMGKAGATASVSKAGNRQS